MYYAEYAESHQIPILCIGTELELTSGREKEWRTLIDEIRVVFSGELTYAANFTEYEKIRFWDALDYIGIQAYFPLTDRVNPGLESLKKGWNKKSRNRESTEEIQQTSNLYRNRLLQYCRCCH